MKNTEITTNDLCTYKGKYVIFVAILPMPYDSERNACVQDAEDGTMLFVNYSKLYTEEDLGKRVFDLQNDLKRTYTKEDTQNWEDLDELDKAIYMEMAAHFEFKEED